MLARSSELSVPFRLSNKNSESISYVPHTCYMRCRSYPPWSDRPNNIWWRVQIMKLLTVQFSPASWHFIPLRSKYSGLLPCNNKFVSELKKQAQDEWGVEYRYECFWKY
jgi:hypothetical protein